MNYVLMLKTTMDGNALARLGRALADDSRRRILVRLLDGPAYPAELATELDLARPSVSNHLACLFGCGLVVKEREGRNLRYELSDPRLAHALSELCHVMLGPAIGCDHEEDARCDA